VKRLDEWLCDRGDGVRPSSEEGNFLLFQTDQTMHMRSTELPIQDRGYLPGGILGGMRGWLSLSSGQYTTKWSYVSVPPTYLQCMNRDNLNYTEFIANVKLTIKLKILR